MLDAILMREAGILVDISPHFVRIEYNCAQFRSQQSSESPFPCSRQPANQYLIKSYIFGIYFAHGSPLIIEHGSHLSIQATHEVVTGGLLKKMLNGTPRVKRRSMTQVRPVRARALVFAQGVSASCWKLTPYIPPKTRKA
jgi:hypothetical protein